MKPRLQRHLTFMGDGSKPLEMTWRDYLVLLLHLGAEIEHALMVEYLYAAYSLGGDQIPHPHRPMVQRWQANILKVAREEMGHLLTVQNLLCLLGGPISFEREDPPWQSQFSPFPFTLAPLTLDTLAHYVYAEMPPRHEMPSNTAAWEFEVYDAVSERIEREGAHRQHHHVATIYGLIIELIGDPVRIPDSSFRGESYAAQASWDEWGRGHGPGPPQQDAPATTDTRADHGGRVIVTRMATRTEALAALKDVAGQGEAPQLRGAPRDAHDEPSHFGRFAGIYREMASHEGLFIATRPVPVNPTTAAPMGKTTSTTYIESETSRSWASLFNLRYRMLLTNLSHSYRLSRADRVEGPGVRGATLHRVFAEMYNLKTIAGLLVRMPLVSDANDPRRAGPPFQMPYSLELPQVEADCWRLHLDLLATSQHLCAALIDNAPPDGKAYLASLRDLDRQSIGLIDEILAVGTRRHK